VKGGLASRRFASLAPATGQAAPEVHDLDQRVIAVVEGDGEGVADLTFETQ
jgi:hypothetical protein